MPTNADLQAVIEAINAGRTSNLTCPFCKQHKLKKGMGDYGPAFTCPGCKQFIEAPAEDF